MRFFYALLYIGLLALIFFGLSDKIIYARNDSILGWLPLLLIFIALPLLLYKTLQRFRLRPKISLLIAISSILILGPTWGIYQRKQQDEELAKYGKQTIGIVYTKWETFRMQRHYEWLLKCEFIINGKKHSTFSESDKKNIYHIGDTLHVLYSERNPENSLIMELKDR